MHAKGDMAVFEVRYEFTSISPSYIFFIAANKFGAILTHSVEIKGVGASWTPGGKLLSFSGLAKAEAELTAKIKSNFCINLFPVLWGGLKRSP